MWLYLAVVAFPLMVGSIYNETTRSKRKFSGDDTEVNYAPKTLLFISALPMFLLIAFRHTSIGADTYVYQLHFFRTIEAPWGTFTEITEMEEGYTTFVKLITYITEDPLVFQCIVTAIYLLCLVSFVSHLETDSFLVLFLFGTLGMYTFMFTAIRQCLAISLCMFSYKYIKNRKLIPFIILIVLATLIHKSSFIFVAAYFVYVFELSPLNIIAYIFSTGFAVVFLELLQGWFNEQLEYDYDVEGGTGGIVFSIAVLGMMIFAVIFAFQKGESKSHFTGIVNIGIISAIFWTLRIFTRTAERPSFYFLPFVFVAVSHAIDAFEDERDKTITKYVIIVLSVALFCYRVSNNYGTNFIPYRIFEY